MTTDLFSKISNIANHQTNCKINRMKRYIFILSAEQGFAKAQYNLGIYYGLGQGVTKNYELAYMWSSIAFLNGVKLAKQNIDFLAKKLTPSQIEKVKTLTLECIEKGYKGC